MDMSLSFRRLLCAGLLSLGAAAGAQTLTLSFPSAEDSFVVRHPLSASTCAASPVSIGWTFNRGARRICTDLQVWASTEPCTSTPGFPLFHRSESDLLAASSGSAGLPALSEWPGFEGRPCGMEGMRVLHYICGRVVMGDVNGDCGNNSSEVTSRNLRIVYTTQKPPAPIPTGDETEGGPVNVKGYDGQATIHFSAPGNDLDEVLLFELIDEKEQERSKVKVSVGSSIPVSGLEDGPYYRFFLRAVDLAGNTSEPSREIEVYTVRTDGFWDLYKQNGGAGGGCRSAGQGSLAALALGLLGFGLVRRLC